MALFVPPPLPVNGDVCDATIWDDYTLALQSFLAALPNDSLAAPRAIVAYTVEHTTLSAATRNRKFRIPVGMEVTDITLNVGSEAGAPIVSANVLVGGVSIMTSPLTYTSGVDPVNVVKASTAFSSTSIPGLSSVEIRVIESGAGTATDVYVVLHLRAIHVA